MIIDKLLSVVAPHYCLACQEEGFVVCDWCYPDIAPKLPDRCFLCRSLTANSQVCKNCRRKCKLRHVWVRTKYDGIPKQLIHDFKFVRKKAASVVIAKLMCEALPYFDKDTIIAHVPTATGRVRQRGYDQSLLLAKDLSRMLGLKHRTLLIRTTQTRQVGAKRIDRIKQMEKAFLPANSESLKGKKILLVDDLTTTGASLNAAATCLRNHGAKEVNAIVFAQK